MQSSTATAQTAAETAQTAATNAATLAGNKGEVIYQWQTPAAARQLPQNLWIDTNGGKNTPKRWDGSAWVVVTDKAALDAQNAANEAQSTADEALGKANTATSNIATIKTELTATTSKTNATANQVTTIQTTVNGHTSSIQTQQTSINGLSAQSVLTLDVNGYVTGVGSYNDGKKGSFAIRADEFWIASPDNKSKVRPLVYYPSSTTINGVTVPSGLYLDGNLLATGTITGDKIRANTEINAPIIKGGQININDKFIVDSLGNVTAKNGTFEGDVRLKNGQVDTLQIANNAVTVPRYIYIADEKVSDRPAEMTGPYYPIAQLSLGSFTYDAQDSAAVSLFVSIDYIKAGRLAAGGGNWWVKVHLKKNGSVMHTWTRSGKAGGNTYTYEDFWLNLPPYIDVNPKTGGTISLEIECYSSLHSDSVNVPGYPTITARGVTFGMVGAKR